MDVAITTHAVQRFKQRFRLQFHRDAFESSRVKYFIRNLFNQSHSCDFALKQSIGVYNKLCIQNNSLMHYARYKNLVFAYKKEQDTIVILTVMQSGNKIGHVIM